MNNTFATHGLTCWKSLGFACLVTLCGLTSGCGSAVEAPRNVAGNISIDGKPLNQGSVIFTNDKGEHAYADIQGDGSFLIPQLKPGLFRATVSVPPPPKQVASKNPDEERGARPIPVAVPSRYATEETSGLQFSIDQQTEQLTIELKR